MSVKSIGDYEFEPADLKENYDGNQINYVSWDHHLIFASAFLIFGSPDVLFKDFIQNNVVPLIQADPESKNVVWSEVKWLKSNEEWTPDFEKSLSDNGIVHKEQIRFVTDNLPALGAGYEEAI